MSALEKDWLDEALCKGVDVEVFYPEADDTEGIAFAKSICANCPVREECLDAATRREELKRDIHGVVGGLSEVERKALLKPREKNHCFKGHEFTEANTYYYEGREGKVHRGCKACKKAYRDAKTRRAHPQRFTRGTKPLN